MIIYVLEGIIDKYIIRMGQEFLEIMNIYHIDVYKRI